MTDLSKITKIGTEVAVEGFGKIRLLDTQYNGVSVKAWQFTDVVENNVYLGYPNDRNTDGYPTAKKVHKTLENIYERLPKWLKDQILVTPVPCYIPATKRNKLFKAKLFLLSATEICHMEYGVPSEGRPLEFYIKKTPEWSHWHWLRSPNRSYSYYEWVVSNNGNVDYYSVYASYAVVPAFTTK